jgi:hypothetical protein
MLRFAIGKASKGCICLADRQHRLQASRWRKPPLGNIKIKRLSQYYKRVLRIEGGRRHFPEPKEAAYSHKSNMLLLQVERIYQTIYF